MPLQATSGAASYDAFGGGVAAVPTFVEDVFSTYLYTGNGSTQTITNGIDLAGKGGLVWTKGRDANYYHGLTDTTRGVGKLIYSNATLAQAGPSVGNDLTSFNSNGFSLGPDSNVNINTDTKLFVSWTFREQPKFFDVVTYTGTNSARTIAHNLGSVPGWMMVKKTSSTGDWVVYHRSLGATKYLILNTTAREDAYIGFWNDTEPTSSVFSIGTDGLVNASGASYVAYLFAHNAGGFGLTGTDNVISCGSFTTDGSGNATVSLGYEPQWVLIKSSSNGDGWQMVDTMRGMAVSNGLYNGDQVLQAQASSAETSGAFVQPSATGFDITYYSSSRTYIYIAIRRGPMKVPTSGTSVFSPIKAYNATGTKNTTNFAVDLQIAKNFTDGGSNNVNDRLRGVSSISTETTTSGPFLYTDTTAAEVEAYRTLGWDNTGFKTPGYFSNYDIIFYNFKRAPSFFDEVCYTGDGTDNRQITHNLGVVPELIINKNRNAAWPWWVGGSVLGSTSNGMFFNTTGAIQDNPAPKPFSTNGSAFTSNYFLVSSVAAYPPNASGFSNIAYLFATCAGVSKVGSYTGNGSTQTIDCGFASGARFVLLKRTDAAGGWYTYDTARGMTTLTDPYLLLNSTAAESATLGSVTTVSTGFALNAGILAAINTNGASYIFLAIA